MDAREARVLYLAVADGRGHLMRAHLLRPARRQRGSRRRCDHLATRGKHSWPGLGTPAALLPGGFQLLFDDCHRMLARPHRAQAGARYLGLAARPRPRRCLLGRARRGRRASSSTTRFTQRRSGWRRRRAWPARTARASTCTATTCGERPCTTSMAACPPWPSGGFRRFLRALDARAFGRIAHSRAPPIARGRRDATGQSLSPPAAVAAPRRARAAVRSAPGPSASASALAAIYRNPHFRDPRLAAPPGDGAGAAGFRSTACRSPGRGAPAARLRPRLRRRDRGQRFVVSGAGAAAWSKRGGRRVPLLALRGDQPEQALDLGQPSSGGRRARGRRRGFHGALPSDCRAHHRGAGGAGAPRRTRARPAAVDRCFPVTGDTEQGGTTWNQK